MFKPAIGTPIDWGATLAQDLLFFFPCWEGGGQAANDVVNGLSAAFVGSSIVRPTWVPGTYGVGLQSQLDGGYAATGSIPASLQVGWPITIAVSCRFGGTHGSGPKFFGIDYNSAFTTPYLVIALYENSIGKLGVQYNNAGTLVSATSIATIVAGTDYVFSYTITPTAQTAYVNGIAVSSLSASISNPSYSATSRVVFGDLTLNSNLSYYWAAVWNRALVASEHAAIGSQVNGIWQIFMPPYRLDTLTYLDTRHLGQIARPVCDRTGSDRRIWAD